MYVILLHIIKSFSWPSWIIFPLNTDTPSHRCCPESRGGMSFRLTEFTAIFRKAAAYRMCGQKNVKARRQKLIVKSEWHEKYLSVPFTCGCVDLEEGKILSGWGTCKAWLKFFLAMVPQRLQCLPCCFRLQAALFSPFLALARSNLLKEHFGYPCIFPRPPFFVEATWPLGLYFSTNAKKITQLKGNFKMITSMIGIDEAVILFLLHKMHALIHLWLQELCC